MRVVSNKALLDFSANHSDASAPLQDWRRLVEIGRFETHAALKATFSTVDKAGGFHVFNIGGNKYRLIASIHFNRQMLFVRHVFTHKGYNAWTP